ncbi:MAG TPA: response regulator transcription factor [Candidimonas sp.]|nr:response regulator transcription factor [Candidimonas sp.]
MIKVLIADDHNIVRHGLKQFLALATDVQVVGDVADGQQLLERLAEGGCDVVVLDMTMPGRSGVELIKRVRQLEGAPPILVLSMHNEVQLVSRALKAGAAGYLTKDSEPETLIGAIRKIARGGRYIDPMLVDKMVFDYGLGDARPPHDKLSNREFQVLHLLVQGKSINDIADGLSLSAKTISTHKLRLMQKMQMNSMADLVRYAIEHGLA